MIVLLSVSDCVVMGERLQQGGLVGAATRHRLKRVRVVVKRRCCDW